MQFSQAHHLKPPFNSTSSENYQLVVCQHQAEFIVKKKQDREIKPVFVKSNLEKLITFHKQFQPSVKTVGTALMKCQNLG